MGSKIFLLLGLSIAFVLLINSEVAARDLAETTSKTGGASLDADYPTYQTSPGCPFYCDGVCCSAAAAAQALKAKTQVKP
ncbi:hypothetical protein AgCh_003060 [Apium graveolens]